MNRKQNWISSGAAGLSLLTVLWLPAELAHALKMGVSQFLSPLLATATHGRQICERVWAVPRSREELLRENQELLAQVETLQERLRATAELEQENVRLRALFGFAQPTKMKLLGAHVIGRDASNWWKTILVDRGSADGVKENMAVLTAHGVVGKTLEVSPAGPHVCRVLLLSDPNCKVSALAQTSREFGIVTGTGRASEINPQYEMNFLSRGAAVQRGDRIVTAGLGGVFPKGVMIGQVESVKPNGLIQTALIQPAVDLAHLEEVLILMEESLPRAVSP